MSNEEKVSFEEAAKPLIKWLSENSNPHAIVIVEVNKAVLYSGNSSLVTDEYFRD